MWKKLLTSAFLLQNDRGLGQVSENYPRNLLTKSLENRPNTSTLTGRWRVPCAKNACSTDG